MTSINKSAIEGVWPSYCARADVTTAFIVISGARKDEDKPSIYMQGGFHAREWIAPATVLVMVNQLLSNYGSDEAITVLIDNIDWYVLPLANVDGYVYTWTEDRFWRKTRSVNENQDCNGTDPNRNWDYDWGGAGTSDIACSPIYGGSSPFSEREVREVAGFITKHNFDAFLDFHAYGQIWMAPWSYSLSSTPDYAEQMEVLKLAIEAVNATNGMEYISGQISHIFSPTSGSSGDWAYGTAHIKYTYGIELRDVWYGDYGFLLPEDQILATGLETFAGVKAIASYILEHATDSDNSTL
ncbi:carboxypeptidase B-like [Saccoglossus kowalevskii]